jgi:hypothetical protein
MRKWLLKRRSGWGGEPASGRHEEDRKPREIVGRRKGREDRIRLIRARARGSQVDMGTN